MTRILFVAPRVASEPYSNFDIMSMRLGAPSSKDLTKADHLDDRQPQASPDGRTIVFVRDSQIAVMHADGSHVRQLTHGGSSNNYPHWSPDGKKIVFESDRVPPHHFPQLFVMNADGSHQHSLDRVGVSPVYSPDGKQIAYTEESSDPVGIVVIHADGSHYRRVAPTGIEPAWFPNGKKLVFSRESKHSLWTVDSDGTDLQPLAAGKFVRQPAVSRSGKKILATIGGSGPSRVGILKADGSDAHLITPSNRAAIEPSWARLAR